LSFPSKELNYVHLYNVCLQSSKTAHIVCFLALCPFDLRLLDSKFLENKLSGFFASLEQSLTNISLEKLSHAVIVFGIKNDLKPVCPVSVREYLPNGISSFQADQCISVYGEVY
jgi:hypothetical protein